MGGLVEPALAAARACKRPAPVAGLGTIGDSTSQPTRRRGILIGEKSPPPRATSERKRSARRKERRPHSAFDTGEGTGTVRGDASSSDRPTRSPTGRIFAPLHDRSSRTRLPGVHSTTAIEPAPAARAPPGGHERGEEDSFRAPARFRAPHRQHRVRRTEDFRILEPRARIVTRPTT